MERIVAYNPGSLNIQTSLGSNGKGIYFGQSKYQLKKEHPNIQFISLDQAVKEIEAVQEFELCDSPKEITAEDWEEALCELYPADWKPYGGGSYFHNPEMWTMDISNCYFKVLDKKGKIRYFSCLNRVSRKPELLMECIKIVSAE